MPPTVVTWERYRRHIPVLLLPAAVVAVGGALWLGEPVSTAGAPPAWVLVALIALGCGAALYAPLGPTGIGLGAAVLPVAAFFFGPPVVAIAAAIASLARNVAAGWRGSGAPGSRAGRSSGALAAHAGQVALAALAAAAVWGLLVRPGRTVEPSTSFQLATAAAAVAAYLVTVAGLELSVTAAAGNPPDVRSALLPLGIDLGGLALGLPIAGVAVGLGWGVSLALLAAIAALSAEAARLARRWRRAERRIEELREVTRAGHRIISRNPDLLGIAEQIQLECRKVLEFEWFQFELLAEEGGEQSWWAGPERVVAEGTPIVPDMPPTLPGIHRRTGWRVIEREFGTDDEVVARLRLWCDPRRLDDEALELLESMLPQMAASVQRALLDRVAKRDPLTDLPDRRAFDSHLARVFETCRREGTPMAVILCDVDSFKRINDLSGHAVGDQALLVVSRLLESQSREEDFCARIGGDEFAVVLEHGDGKTALGTAERIRKAVARRKRADLKTRIPLRLTAGVAGFPELPVRSPAELMELADEAMYEAKRRGKNRCLLYLGRGRFREPQGTVVGEGREPEVEPPTLFA